MPTDRFSQVLVVEDNEPERRLLCDILEEEGFQATGCGTAAEAVEQVRGRQFGVAIVDLRLPDFSGNELLQQVRLMDEQVQVIIYTGAASFDSVKEAINLGAFAYVEKLRDPGELLRHVHRAVRERTRRYAADLEAAVRRRTEQLARSNRDLESFASVVAHDLRSPLLTISGYCEILQEEFRGKLEPAANEYLSQIVAGVRRMSRLIEDLLNYSRVARSEVPLQPVDMDVVLAEAVANLEAAIRESKARVESERLPRVAGVRAQLLQLLQNLVGNALKFRRDLPPVVRVQAVHQENCWQFSVEDNGIGIEPQHFDRIFLVFQRLHRQEYAGTGIGLAVCKKIVELHGGRIWLTSRPGQGTTFFFTLPDRPGIAGAARGPVG
jgi:light-regulated signal transduction histidine kinase (bacteriophytochrome)